MSMPPSASTAAATSGSRPRTPSRSRCRRRTARATACLPTRQTGILDARLLDGGRLFILYAKGKKLTAIELHARDLSSPLVSYELPASIK